MLVALDSRHYGLYVACLLPYMALPFCPLFSFILAFLLLLACGRELDGLCRITLGVGIILSGSILYASRMYFHWEGDDFIRYFATYRTLLNGDIMQVFSLYKLECALGFWYVVLIALFGELAPASVLFWTIFPAGVLFYIWLEKYAMSELKQSEKSLCVALSLLFFDFYIASEYTRQFFASLVILYALYARTTLGKLFALALATLFHTSTLLIAPLLFALRHYSKATLAISFAVVMLAGLAFPQILALYNSGALPRELPLFDKLGFYAMGFGEFMPNAIELGLVIMVAGLFLLPTNDPIKKRWFFFVVWFVMMYFALHLVIGGIAHRFTILFTTILLGFLLFVGLRGLGIAAVCFGGGALLYRLKTMLFGKEHIYLFDSYGVYGEWFYYIFKEL